MNDIFDILNSNAIEYKGHFIDVLVIDYITIGDKKYDGFTKYSIRTKDNAFIAGEMVDGEPQLKEFTSLEEAKKFIDKKTDKYIYVGE